VSMRPSSASPATGLPANHKQEQAAVIAGALGIGGAEAQSTAVLPQGTRGKKGRKD